VDVLGHPEYGDERDDDALWEAIRPAAEPSSTRWFLPLVLGLLAAGTPWHAMLGWTTAMWGGLPLWVWISLGSGVGLSAVTAVASLRAWRDPDFETLPSAAAATPGRRDERSRG
jgi:hypothetical protein